MKLNGRILLAVAFVALAALVIVMLSVKPGEADEAVGDARRRQRVLIIMCLALAGVIASVSGLNVALQQLAADLGASQSQLLWIINGYTLALAALLMPVGAIGAI